MSPDRRRFKVFTVPAMSLSTEAMAAGEDVAISGPGLPADATLTGVSHAAFFDRDAVAFRVSSDSFPIVPRGEVQVPEPMPDGTIIRPRP